MRGGERTSSKTPSRDQSRWAESSTTVETPRVRCSRAQLARAARSTTSQRPNREAWKTSSVFTGCTERERDKVPWRADPFNRSLVSSCDPLGQPVRRVRRGWRFGQASGVALRVFSAGRNVEENASVGIAKAKVTHMRSQSRIGCSPSSERVPVSGLRLVKRSSVKPTVGVTGGWVEIFHLDRLHSRSNVEHTAVQPFCGFQRSGFCFAGSDMASQGITESLRHPQYLHELKACGGAPETRALSLHGQRLPTESTVSTASKR